MTMITPSYLGETIEYSSLHACRSTLEDPTIHDGGRSEAKRRLARFEPGWGPGEGPAVEALPFSNAEIPERFHRSGCFGGFLRIESPFSSNRCAR